MADTPILLRQYWKQGDLGNKVGALDPEQLMAYIRDNALPLLVEVGEALKETGWKPWATSNHLNRDKFLGELADIQLFLDNLKLAALADRTETAVFDLDHEFNDIVSAKITQAVERDKAGYTGLKCPYCDEDSSLAKVIDTNIEENLKWCRCGATAWPIEENVND